MNREQRRALIAESLKSDPQLSNREHARRTGASDKTVESVRADAEANAEIPHYEASERLEASGRAARGAAQQPRPEPAPGVQPCGLDELNTAITAISPPYWVIHNT